MPHRPLLLPLLTAALVLGAGACADRERPASSQDAPAEGSPAPSRAEQRRIAADSVRAVNEVRREAASTAEKARQAAGVVEDSPPRKSTEKSSPDDEYAHCMRQSEAATGPVRETIVRACERLRAGGTSEP
ncbi:MAG TPA: hypothetical protein VLK84_16345 [Longimicrobium sp.]|nr:hypothetical protein [Longimicrobium sp.]